MKQKVWSNVSVHAGCCLNYQPSNISHQFVEQTLCGGRGLDFSSGPGLWFNLGNGKNLYVSMLHRELGWRKNMFIMLGDPQIVKELLVGLEHRRVQMTKKYQMHL